MRQANSGRSGAVRVQTLDATDLSAMEKHGQRTDASGQARRVSEDEPLVRGGLDVVARRDEHVEGRKQQGKTKAIHALVQFPQDLIPNTAIAQRAMLGFAVDFINDFYGGDAVFAARLDRDEKGTHKVDVFFLPRWEFQYKDGRQQGRCGLGQFTKKEARKRFGKDDRRAQGSALQDAWFEYLRDEMKVPGVMPPERKKSVAKDRVEPEVYALQKDRDGLRQIQGRLKAKQSALSAKQQQIEKDADAVAAQLKILGKRATQMEKIRHRNR